jgi:hypothetical protein
LDTAGEDRSAIRNNDDGAPRDQRVRRSQVKIGRPQRQQELGRHVRVVVDEQGIGREAQGGDGGGQAHGRQEDPGRVDEAEEAGLGLVVELLGLNLELGGRELGLELGSLHCDTCGEER